MGVVGMVVAWRLLCRRTKPSTRSSGRQTPVRVDTPPHTYERCACRRYACLLVCTAPVVTPHHTRARARARALSMSPATCVSVLTARQETCPGVGWCTFAPHAQAMREIRMVSVRCTVHLPVWLASYPFALVAAPALGSPQVHLCRPRRQSSTTLPAKRTTKRSPRRSSQRT